MLIHQPNPIKSWYGIDGYFVALLHSCVICLTSPYLKTLQTGAVLKHVTCALWMLAARNNSGVKKMCLAQCWHTDYNQIINWECSQGNIFLFLRLYWSGREDSNLRPHHPQRCELPGCATARRLYNSQKKRKVKI